MKFLIYLVLNTILLSLCYSNAQNLVTTSKDEIVIEASGIAYLGSGITEEEGKIIALNDAKRNALEQAGTFIESHTEILNQKLKKDEIVTYAGGSLKTEIIRETKLILENSFAIEIKIKAIVNKNSLKDNILVIKNKYEQRYEIEKLRDWIKTLEKKIDELNIKKGKIQVDQVKYIVKSYNSLNWYYKGKHEKENKNYSQAIKYFNTAIEYEPTFFGYYHSRAITYTLLSKFNEAIKDYSTSINLNPEFSKSYFGRAAALFAIGQDKDAAYDSEKFIELIKSKSPYNPKDTKEYLSVSYMTIGMANFQNGNIFKAIKNFTHAINYSNEKTKSALYYFFRGRCFLSIKNYQNALNDLTECISIDPLHVPAYKYRGTCYGFLNQDELAIYDLNTYLKLSRNNNNDSKEIRELIKAMGYEPKY